MSRRWRHNPASALVGVGCLVGFATLTGCGPVSEVWGIKELTRSHPQQVSPLGLLQLTGPASPTNVRLATFTFRINRSDARFLAVHTTSAGSVDLGIVASGVEVPAEAGENVLRLTATASGSEPVTEEWRWTYDDDAPSVPTRPGAVVESTQTIALSWGHATDRTTDIGKYRVYYDTVSRAAGGEYQGADAKAGRSPIVVDKISALNLDGLRPATHYFFRVDAVDLAGNPGATTEEFSAGTHSGSTGVLFAAAPESTGDAAAAVLTADFDADLETDIATLSRRGSEWSIVVRLSGDGQKPRRTVSTVVPGKPIAFASEYFDDDSFVDIALLTRVEASTSDVLYVAKGDGAGGFQLEVQATFPAEPDAGTVTVAAGRIDADGFPDIVVGRQSGISIFHASVEGKLPTGRFVDPYGAPIRTGAPPTAISVADMDGDGVNDLVYSTSGDSAEVLVGSLTSSAEMYDVAKLRPVPLRTGAPSNAILARDLDGNGAEDVAVVTDKHVFVFLDKGTGGRNTRTQFAAGVPYLEGKELGAIIAGDFDGNEILDLAVVDKGKGEIDLLPGLGRESRGTGEFGKSAAYPSGNTPVGVALVDFSGDGIIDVIGLNSDDGTLRPLIADGNRRRGDGGFSPPELLPLERRNTAILHVDLNADGIQDLVSMSTGDPSAREQTLTVRLGLGRNGRGSGQLSAAVFETKWSCVASDCVSTVAAGDFDSDGVPDLLVLGMEGSVEVIQILHGLARDGRGTGEFRRARSFVLPQRDPYTLAVGDFNSDGADDVALLSGSTGELVIYTNRVVARRGTGDLLPVQRIGGVGSGSGEGGVVAADFDRDGILDLAVARRVGSSQVELSIEIYAGAADKAYRARRGDGTFEPVPLVVAAGTGTAQTGFAPRSLTLANINNDAMPDLVALRRDTLEPRTSLLVFRGGRDNQKAATMTFLPSIPVTEALGGAVRLADLDDDRRTDFVVSLDATGEIYVMRGDGFGSILDRKIFRGVPPNGGAQPGRPNPLTVVDFDEDGAHDVLMLSSGDAPFMAMIRGTGRSTSSR